MPVAFRGASNHSLDDKSRLIVPKRFLDQLPLVEREMVLTASQDGCLLLLEKRAFEQVAESIGKEPLDEDPEQRGRRRFVLGHAEDVKPDKAGRIVIPRVLQAYAGLGKPADGSEMMLVGTGSSIELWAPERWHKVLSRFGESSFKPQEAVETAAASPSS